MRSRTAGTDGLKWKVLDITDDISLGLRVELLWNMYYFFCLCENNAPVTSFSEKKKVLPKDFDQWTKEIAEFVQDLRRGTITPERTADPRIGGWIPLAEEHFWEFKQLKGRPF